VTPDLVHDAISSPLSFDITAVEASLRGMADLNDEERSLLVDLIAIDPPQPYSPAQRFISACERHGTHMSLAVKRCVVYLATVPTSSLRYLGLHRPALPHTHTLPYVRVYCYSVGSSCFTMSRYRALTPE
jgi:hypothetical protein